MKVFEPIARTESWREHAVRFAVTRGSTADAEIKGDVSVEYDEGLIPAYSASGQDCWVKTARFAGDGLVLSAVGARCGRTFRAVGRWSVVANTQVFFPRRGYDIGYLWYVFNQPNFWLRGGSAQPFVQVPASLARRWRFPPESEQREIALYLDEITRRIDTIIAKKERLIELLEERRRTERDYLLANGVGHEDQAHSRNALVPTVPRGWTLKKLKRLSPSIAVGVVVNPSAYYADDGVPFLFGSNVREGAISLDGVRRITNESNYILRKSILGAGDIVVVRVGAPGVAAVVPAVLEGSNCASMVIVRRHRSFDSRWLCHAINGGVGRAQVEQVQYGAAQEQFNIGHAVDFVFPVPPIQEQTAIADALDDWSRSTAATRSAIARQCELLREYRQALITAAVTGTLPDAGRRLAHDSERSRQSDTG